MGEKVTLPAEVWEKLAGASGRGVPLCDESGRVKGYYYPSDGAPWTDEDIARLEQERANDPRPDVPHEEVMRWFKENT